MGRYGTPDYSGPTITVNNVSSLFDIDADNWCNMLKYRESYAAGELTGCEYYKSRIQINTTGGANPDLLQNMEIVVSDATSGVSQILVEIGKCQATYDLPTDVASVVASTTAASGVKSGLKTITLKYDAPSTSDAGAPGAGLPSLKSKLAGGMRLDSCLVEGKNYLRVTAKDNSRRDDDGTTYAPNSTTFNDYKNQGRFIKVDNTTAKIGLTGNASNIFDSNKDKSCFTGTGVKIDPLWKNFTITGNLKSTDPFGNDAMSSLSQAVNSLCEKPVTSVLEPKQCLTNPAGVPKPNAV
jgi:hypothetical protein